MGGNDGLNRKMGKFSSLLVSSGLPSSSLTYTPPLGHIRVNKDVETGAAYTFSLAAGADNITVNVQNKRLQMLFEPQPVEVWVDVAATYASIPLEGSQHQPQFVLPIDLVTGVAAERKAKEFVAVWRLIRFQWLREVFETRTPPAFATRRAWKSFTAGVFSGAKIQLHNETSISRIRFAEFLRFKKIIALPRENFTFHKDDVPGSIDDKVTVEMVRDTVHELTDLNFFFDMFEVEYHRTYDSPAEIRDRMRSAISPSSLTFPQKIPRSQLADRARWLAQVRDFIKPWHGKKPREFDLNLPENPTLNEVTALKNAIAHVYCTNVTYTLCRRPVLPRYE